MENDELSIIIPAAGIGKRMKSYGPKSLIQLDSTSNVLSRQLSILQKLHPKADIVIVSGFEHEKTLEFIHQWNSKFRNVGSKEVKVINNTRYSETNVAKSITMATEFCDKDKYLIIYGDLVFNEDTLNNIVFERSGLVVDTEGQLDKLEVGIKFADYQIEKLAYDTKVKWAQIAYLNHADMEEFNSLVDQPRHSKYFSFEIFNMMLATGTRLQCYWNPKMRIVEIDYSKDIDLARQLAKENPL